MDFQSIYSVKINCNGCNFILKVNDFPILHFKKGSNLNTEIPLNKFLKDGLNDFKCDIYPAQEQEVMSDSAYVKLTFLKGDMENSQEPEELTSYKTPSFERKENSPTYSKYVLEGTFTASIFYRSVISNGIHLEFSQDLQNEIFRYYMELWDAFKSRDIESVMRLMTLRIKETANLQGITPSELEKEFREDYNGYMNDSTLELWEFTPDKVFLKIYGYNKVACLEVKNGNQPICYINRNEHLAIYIPVFFYRNPRTLQLEIIR